MKSIRTFAGLAAAAALALLQTASLAAPAALVNAPLDTINATVNAALQNVNTTIAPAGNGNASGSLYIPGVTASVNQVELIGSATGTGVTVIPYGSDSNIPLMLQSVGTSAVHLGGTTAANSSLRAPTVASAVNQVQISGAVTGSPPLIQVGGSGADTNVGLVVTANGTGNVLVGGTTTTLASLQVGQVASRVNDFVLTPAATGNTPGFLAGGAGSDASVGVAFGTQGTGTVAINTGNTLQQFGVTHTASAVNAFSVTGSISSNAPVMSVVGTGTNVNASITGKGTGIVTLGQALCTITGTTPQTCNGQRGIVTTGTLTTAAVTDATFTIADSSVATTSLVMCTIQGYSGTYSTNGDPIVLSCVPGSGSFVVNFRNVHATNALNGAIQFGFAVLN